MGWKGSGGIGKMECLRSGVVYNLACSVSAVCCNPRTNQDVGRKFLWFGKNDKERMVKVEGNAGML